MAIEVDIATSLSILPFPTARLSTHGLVWPLNNEVLDLLGRSGARNRCSARSVHIAVHDGGPVLVVLDAVSVHNVVIDDWELGSLQDIFSCY